MATERPGSYLKYALFCRDTEEGPGDELTFKGVIDLYEVPLPSEPPSGDAPLLGELDVNLAFCIAGATPGEHTLQVEIRAPGLPLGAPPSETVNWEDGHHVPAVDQDLPHPGAAGGPPRRGHPPGRPPGR